MNRFHRSFGVCPFAVILCIAAAPALAVTYGRVALTGISTTGGPNLGAGVTFTWFHPGELFINNNGQVLFRGRLAGVGITSDVNDEGLWAGIPGSNLSSVVRIGSPADELSGSIIYNRIRSPLGLGKTNTPVGVFADVTGPGIDGGNDCGIWGGLLGNNLISFEEDLAPGLEPGVVFSAPPVNPQPTQAFHGPAMNENGQVTFFATLRGTNPSYPIDNSNMQSIWLGSPSSLAVAARAGMNAPGTGSPAARWSLLFDPLINNVGHVAFRGTLTGTGVTGINGRGIWRGPPGAMQLMAREGTQAPGLPAGVMIGFSSNDTGVGRIAVNDAGDVAFFSMLFGPGIDNSNSRSIWIASNGGLALVARQGDPAPETSGVFYGLNTPVINGQGKVAFQANLTAASLGIWTGTPGHLVCIAKDGDPAPGTAAGVSFYAPSTPSINALGQVAFPAGLNGAGVSESNNVGLWAGYPGNLNLIIREGQLFDVDPGPGMDYRLVQSIRTTAPSSGGQDGRPMQINNSGTVVFGLGFTDGSSGVFVATIPACPGSIAPDFNNDCHVDQMDLDKFKPCRTGPGVQYNLQALPSGCLFIPNGSGRIAPDFDNDGDVDHDDFGRIQRCMTGPTLPNDPACMN
jgi:hypothetical protein